MRAELEVSPPGVGFRPADVLLHGLGSDSPLAVDFSVLHPLQLSDDLAQVHPGKLVKAAEKRKIREQFSVCHSAGWGFCPFVVETQGTWGGQARHLIQRLVCLCAAKTAAPRRRQPRIASGAYQLQFSVVWGVKWIAGFLAKVWLPRTPSGPSAHSELFCLHLTQCNGSSCH